MKRNIIFIVIFFLFSSLTALAREQSDSLYQLKSGWQNQDGATVTLNSMRGHPVILAMAYTSCQGSCPLIIENMKSIEKDLSAKGMKDVVFVVFSFDSKRDTPDHLKSYAKAHNLDLKHWTLLHAAPNAVRELAAVLGVRYKEDSRGDFDHSNVISLLDTQGMIKFQQSGLGNGSASLEEKALALTQ